MSIRHAEVKNDRILKPIPATFLSILLVILSCGELAASPRDEMTAPFRELDRTIRARVSDRYGALPLSFITNAGQMDPAVRFQVKGAGHTIFFTPDEVVFRVTSRGEEGTVPASSVVRLRFTGANPSPRVEGLERLAGRA